ncbi:MAG: peptide-methionine (S)-S-oxide reductase [Desulfuromonas sp.]|nr:MAG: peptide-methionine (S)-S-oxide reductase [Desulfuromonas sp.]
METQPTTARAIFAGGCFWCMEPPFKELDGVLAVVSGYIGGETENPTYQQVCSGQTGHAEAIEISYDPQRVDYRKLLDLFWQNIDPTDDGGQFVDRGSQYRSAIFYTDAEQKEQAEDSKRQLEQSGLFDEPIVTEIVAATTFYPAEEYHQDYSKKCSLRYNLYRNASGRDRFLERTWKKNR